jgi:hypothetical protein
MKTCTLLFVIAIAVSANAQDKPRVFVQGKGSENVSSNGADGGDHGAASGSTIESMEVGKNFHKDCSDVIVTINQANADYIVMMNRESEQNLGYAVTGKSKSPTERVTLSARKLYGRYLQRTPVS